MSERCRTRTEQPATNTRGAVREALRSGRDPAARSRTAELLADRRSPGIDSPTESGHHDAGWVAVWAMVLRKYARRIVDDLWELGARGILVTDIHACRI